MKKLVSLVLVFVMLFSLLPLSALAAEDVQTETEQSLETEGSVGTLLGNTLDGAGVMDDEPSACSVTDISVEGKTATVDYQTDRASELVVAIYEEGTNKMLGSGHTIVSADADMATVTIEIETMPAYYIVSAYLLEAETLVPLCDAFTSTYYTQEVSELRQKTAEDFEEERVLLLEEGNTETNFLVFSEDTLVAEQTGDANQIVDNGDGTYTITNADEAFLSLQEGGSFSYTYADGTVLLVVAKAVTVSGTTVTVTADTDVELADMFDYVKIEATNDGVEPVVDTSTMGEGITYLGCEENTTIPMDGAADAEKVSAKLEIKFEFDTTIAEKDDRSVSLKGNFRAGVQASLELLIARDYQYVSFSLKLSNAYSVSVSGKVTAWEQPLAALEYPLVPEVVSLRLQPKLVLEFSGELSLSTEYSLNYSWVYESNNGGFVNKSSAPKTKTKVEFKGEAFLGLKIEASLVVGNKTLEELLDEDLTKISVSASGGLKISMAEDLAEELLGGDDVHHDCDLCFEGKIKAVMSLDVGIKVYRIVSQEYKLLSGEVELCDVYCSWRLSGSDTHMEFGFTTCPHKSYKLTVNAVDPDGEAVEAAVRIADKSTGQTLKFKDGVIDSKGSESLTTTNGKAEVFLPNGEYTVTLSYKGETKTKDITVHNKATKTTFRIATPGPTAADGEIIDSGTCGENVKWELYGSGLLYIYGTGAMEDRVENGVPWCKNRDGIKKVMIGAGVTSVGSNAFHRCISLTSVTIPDSVTSIGSKAFETCTALKIVTIPDSVTSIGDDAFYNCKTLESVTVPDSLTSIGDDVFAYCSALKAIDVGEKNADYSSAHGVLFNKSKTTLYYYPSGKTETSYTIPDSVSTIERLAFEGCTALKSITIPDNVTSIEIGAFEGCTGLKSITIPEDVKSIEPYAFSNCISLENVTIPSNVTSIEGFSGCTSLKSITIPESVTSIGSYAFFDCTALTDVYYTGTETQWKAISIGSQNTYLIDANIHYNYNPTTTVAMDEAVRPVEGVTIEEVTTEETTEEITEETTEEVTTEEITEEVTTETTEETTEEVTEETTTEESTIELVAAYTGVLSEANGQKVAGFTDLVPSARHVLLVMKDANASDPLAASNLLYIVQGKSSATGTLSLVYVPRETVSNPAAVVYGPDKAEFSEAAVMVGKKPIGIVTVRVTLNGSVLTEDVDYTFTSSTGANGVTMVTVTGKGAYSGTAEATLRREPGDVDGNGKTDIMDVLVLLKSVAGITGKLDHGDVNADGTTNIMDVLALLKYVAGIAGSVVY